MFRKKRTKSPKAERPPGPLKSAFQKLKAKFRGKQTPSEASVHPPPVDRFSETLAWGPIIDERTGLVLPPAPPAPPPIPPKTRIPISVSYDPFTGFWTYINLETQVIVPAPHGSRARATRHFARPRVPPVPVDPRFVMPEMQIPVYHPRSQSYLVSDESGVQSAVPGRPSGAVRRPQGHPPGSPGRLHPIYENVTPHGARGSYPRRRSRSRTPKSGHHPIYENVPHLLLPEDTRGRSPERRSRSRSPHPIYENVSHLLTPHGARGSSGRRSRSPFASPGTSKSAALGRRPSTDSEESQL